MTNEKNTTQEAARSVRAPQRVSGFDPMQFARKVTNKAGEQLLTLDLKYKKAWLTRPGKRPSSSGQVHMRSIGH